jgi:uncharacterized protein YbcC (UPF0753/DUF2309 family)
MSISMKNKNEIMHEAMQSFYEDIVHGNPCMIIQKIHNRMSKQIMDKAPKNMPFMFANNNLIEPLTILYGISNIVKQATVE